MSPFLRWLALIAGILAAVAAGPMVWLDNPPWAAHVFMIGWMVMAAYVFFGFFSLEKKVSRIHEKAMLLVGTALIVAIFALDASEFAFGVWLGYFGVSLLIVWTIFRFTKDQE